MMEYSFIDIESCNMCGSHSPFKILGKRLNKSQGFAPSKKMGITTTIVKCSNCGLIFSNPQPIPRNIDDHYNVDPDDYWDDEYFSFSDNYFQGEIRWLMELLPFKKGMKYLDIGAGIGKQMKALSNVGYDSYGIEPSKQFREMAIAKMNIDSSRLIHASIEEASFDSEMFDFISFGAVLEHLYDPSESIKKAMRWLKKGGLIHIEVPSSDWLVNKIINLIYRARGLDYVGNLSPMHVPYHLYEFTLDSFLNNGRNQGYVIKDHKYYVCKTYMPKILDPILKSYMAKTDSGMQLCVWLEKA